MSNFKPVNVKITYYPNSHSNSEELIRESDFDLHQYADDYFSRSWLEDGAEECKHEWVNVSFNFIKEACKHCGVDKKE